MNPMNPEDIDGSETTDRVSEGKSGCRVRSGPRRTEGPAQVRSAPAARQLWSIWRGLLACCSGQLLWLQRRSRQRASPAAAAAAADPDAGLHIVKSPIVGTFYGSPSPGARPLSLPAITWTRAR